MNLFGHNQAQAGACSLPEFHPQTVLRDWGHGQGFRLAEALTGVLITGGTGSGKSSGPGRSLAYSYLAADFGGLVLCAKPDERHQWVKWATECGRADDLVIIDAQGNHRFNFLEWEAARPEAGGGFAINVVALLDEVAGAIANAAGSAEGGGGDSKFWTDSLHHLNTNLVDLPLLAGLRVSLPLMRSIVTSAPQSLAQVADPQWQQNSACAATLREADKVTAKADADVRADFEECQNYWLLEYPTLGEKTRGIISLSFSMLVRPLITRPLRRLFATDTNIQPEDTFKGKILIIDLPVQTYRLAGRVANLVWKYCTQIAILRRLQPANGFLRPVFIFCDEAQNFISAFDSEYQAVARSAGGATVYMTQNRESFRRVLGDDDTVDSLLGNLQAKFFCQNTGATNKWAAELLGERWVQVNSTNVGQSRNDGAQIVAPDTSNHSAGVTRSEQRRYFVEPSRFTTLKRGGALNNFQVQAIVYNGGALFPSGKELLPYTLLTFNQK